MGDPVRVAVTAVGLVCGLGDRVDAVRARLDAGESAITALGDPEWPGARGARVSGPALERWLLRRKDAKLLPRAAALALPAAGDALTGFGGDRERLGLFFGVRREPPDAGEADAAIAASASAGALDTAKLARVGRDLYPPLLPLRTLPNMVLAHVSINLGILGPADTSAGGAAAGLMALRAAIHAVAEGRCPAALAGAAISDVDCRSQRDRARLALAHPPGEAAVVLRLEPEGAEGARFHVEDGGAGFSDKASSNVTFEHHRGLGDCGTVDGLLALVLGAIGPVRAGEPQRAWACVLKSP